MRSAATTCHTHRKVRRAPPNHRRPNPVAQSNSRFAERLPRASHVTRRTFQMPCREADGRLQIGLRRRAQTLSNRQFHRYSNRPALEMPDCRRHVRDVHLEPKEHRQYASHVLVDPIPVLREPRHMERRPRHVATKLVKRVGQSTRNARTVPVESVATTMGFPSFPERQSTYSTYCSRCDAAAIPALYARNSVRTETAINSCRPSAFRSGQAANLSAIRPPLQK